MSLFTKLAIVGFSYICFLIALSACSATDGRMIDVLGDFIHELTEKIARNKDLESPDIGDTDVSAGDIAGDIINIAEDIGDLIEDIGDYIEDTGTTTGHISMPESSIQTQQTIEKEKLLAVQPQQKPLHIPSTNE